MSCIKRCSFLFKALLFLVLSGVASMAFSAAPECRTLAEGNYCLYEGKVRSLYARSNNLMLIYFDATFDPAVAANVGFNVTSGNAAAFLMTDAPEFAKLLYSTALAAQSTGRNIKLQMRDTVSGYLKIDRIWLDE